MDRLCCKNKVNHKTPHVDFNKYIINMIKNTIQLLAKISNWKFIIPFFLFTAFWLYLFNVGQKEMSKIAGEEVVLIDLWSGYDLEEITAFFELLKPEGRAIHQQLTGINDMIFPFAYGPLLILVFALILKNIFEKNSKWLLLSLFPLLTMGVDYLENFNTLLMLKSYPNISEVIVNKGSFFTEIKNLSTLIIKISFILLSIVWIAKMVRNFVIKKENKL